MGDTGYYDLNHREKFDCPLCEDCRCKHLSGTLLVSEKDFNPKTKSFEKFPCSLCGNICETKVPKSKIVHLLRSETIDKLID